MFNSRELNRARQYPNTLILSQGRAAPLCKGSCQRQLTEGLLKHICVLEINIARVKHLQPLRLASQPTSPCTVEALFLAFNSI